MAKAVREVCRAFAPLLNKQVRYLGAYGGRGSGKSHFFAEELVWRAYAKPGFRAVCAREIQKSIRFSSRQLIVDKINRYGLESAFDVQEQFIRTPGGGFIIFNGLQDHTSDSIKSLEGFDVAWIEEAQCIGVRSWELLRPTIMRNAGAQIWASWNPESPEDPVDQHYRGPGSEDGSIICVQANWRDNKWFGEGMDEERRSDMRRMDPSKYEHIWEGGYLTISDALIFKGRVEYGCEFEAPDDARFYYGVDWGFSQDPTAIIRCFILNDILHIDYAEGGVGIELDNLPALFDRVPGTKAWPIKADNARPETISYLANRHGYRISGADKWKGSVEDGVTRLQAFSGIRVHHRAEKAAKEFRLYSYKVDRRTGDILPRIEDANNHWIDALRYALDGLIQNRRAMPDFSAFAGPPTIRRSFV